MADEEFPEEVKTFIVTRLACFDPPSVVAKAVKEEFGLAETPSRQRIHRYDPETKAGADLSDQLKAVFAETRKRFLEETARIGIANKAVRLRKLDRVASDAEASGNYMLVLAALEQAAKEEGGAFTNKRELSGPGGGPIKTEGEVAVVTDRDRAKAMAALIAKGRAQAGEVPK